MPGVIRTRVGYAGGTTDSPTYSNLGDHSESIQIVYDPERVSYEELLAVFWEAHNPVWLASTQYRSAIFYHNEEQHRLAVESKLVREAERDVQLFTEIAPAGTFTPAEAYHQKYRLQGDSDLYDEFRVLYPAEAEFVASTAAARVNGYLGGYGSLEQLRAERDGLGLSAAAVDRLIELVAQRGPR
jgi:peptide-methionine (S)-S-oxide reductase